MTQGSDSVSPEPRRRLQELAARAQDRSARLRAGLDRRRGQPAAPGDLFVLRATAELPVEWAVLERSGDPGKLLAVPADTQPLCGTADVEVAAEAPGGPLSLRCRFGVWLEAARFDPDLRTGTLAPEAVAAALDRCRQWESDALEPSPLAEEVDADPEYRDWIREVPQRAAALAAAPPEADVRRFPSRSWGTAHALAAVFALLAIGLTFWSLRLQREVNRLSAPAFDMPSANITLGQETRGETVVTVPRDASQVLFELALDPSLEPQDGYLELVRHSGEPVWRSPRIRLVPSSSKPLLLSRGLLPDGDYRVRVLPAAGFGARPLAVERIRVETAE